MHDENPPRKPGRSRRGHPRRPRRRSPPEHSVARHRSASRGSRQVRPRSLACDPVRPYFGIYSVTVARTTISSKATPQRWSPVRYPSARGTHAISVFDPPVLVRLSPDQRSLSLAPAQLAIVDQPPLATADSAEHVGALATGMGPSRGAEIGDRKRIAGRFAENEVAGHLTSSRAGDPVEPRGSRPRFTVFPFYVRRESPARSNSSMSACSRTDRRNSCLPSTRSVVPTA